MGLGQSENKEDVDVENLPAKSVPLKERVINVLASIHVEPIIFLFSLGFALINIQMPTLYVQKTCKVGSYFWGNQTFSDEVGEET